MNRANSATATQPPLRSNLPTIPTSFVGRKRETAEIIQLLATTHLLSLVGAGGCGKTRIALRVAAELIGQFADGIYWVALARLADPMLVPQTVATVLNVVEQPGKPLTDRLLDSLCDKQLLLVFDNCEHLLGACAQLVEAFISCPNISILATSREPLGVIGEMLYPVLPLALPAVDLVVDEIGQVDSVQLFVERARSILPTYGLTPDNAEIVATICRDLDGIPLAIELASARVNILSVQQIQTRLDHRLDLLVSASRADERHRTLRAAIDWSYDLLSSPERQVLQRLAVFAAGFTLNTAESVCADDEIQHSQMLDLLSSLVNKSLIVAETIQGSDARYHLLETIRQYVQEKLVASNEWSSTHDRHLECFLQLTEETEPKLRTPYQHLWLNWLETEHDNIRAALAWALEQQRIELGLRLANSLNGFWDARGYIWEGNPWYERLLPHADDKIPLAVRSNALTFSSFMAMFVGDATTATLRGREAVALCEAAGEEGKPLLPFALAGLLGGPRLADDYQTMYMINERIIELYRELDDAPMLGMSLFIQGGTAISLGKYDTARPLLEESLAIARAAGDSFRIANFLNSLGDLARCEGHFVQAQALYEESLSLLRPLGAARDIPVTLHNLAHVYLQQGDIESAHALFRESLEAQHARSNGEGIAQGLLGFAALAAVTGLTTESAHLFGAAVASSGWNSTIFWPAKKIEHDYYLGLIRAELSDAEFEAEQAIGRALSIDEAINYALNLPLPLLATSQEGVEPSQALTEREREVAALIALGKSNSEIAGELVVSKRTVEKHIANVLSKLDFTSRAQIVRWAIENGLADPGD